MDAIGATSTRHPTQIIHRNIALANEPNAAYIRGRVLTHGNHGTDLRIVGSSFN